MPVNQSTKDIDIEVDAQLFAAVAQIRCTYKDSPRPFFKGVHVRPHFKKGVFIESCNGSAFAVAHDPSGKANRAYICGAPSETFGSTDLHTLVSEASKKKHKGARISFNSKSGFIAWHGADEKIIEVEFPKTDTLFPNLGQYYLKMESDNALKTNRPICLQGDMLAKFTRASKILGNQCGELIITNATSTSEPVRIEIPDHRFFGGLMTFRTESEQNGTAPKWAFR